jgi:hypothetical protein
VSDYKIATRLPDAFVGRCTKEQRDLECLWSF